MLLKDNFKHVVNLASDFQLTHAEIVNVSEDKKGLYQCRVIPHLSSIDDITNLPWYPILSPKKLNFVPGDFVWLYVSSDLWVGYIIDKLNIHSQDSEKQEEIFENITAALSEIDSDIAHTIDYSLCSYQSLSDNTYMVWDPTFTGIVDIVNKSLISLSGADILLAGTAMHIANDVQIGTGESAAVKAADLADILDEIEEHRHISPVGPVDSARTANLAPLSSRIAQFRKTMSSTKLYID